MTVLPSCVQIFEVLSDCSFFCWHPQMVQQRKQEEEDERQRAESHALQRAERAKMKQASLNKLQESWTTQEHTTLNKPNGKRGRGRPPTAEEAPQYESESGDDADGMSNNDDDDAGQADRYGDGAVSTDAGGQTRLPQANLKDIGLSSSSDDSDEEGLGGEVEGEENGAGQKRKWNSDDDEDVDAADGDQNSSAKRRTVGADESD